MYGAEVNEAFFCADVSEVGEPNLVWILSFKSLVQTVDSDRQLMIGFGSCDTEFWSCISADASLLHNSGNGVFSALDADFEQFAMHSRTAVGVEFWTLSNSFDCVENDVPLCLSRFGRLHLACPPLVESGAADEEHFALDFDRPNVSVLADKLKPQEFSFAKKAVAFFKISRSILS